MTHAFKKVPRNVLVTGLGQIAGTCLGFVATILTARYLGVYDFGRFNFFFGLAFVFWFIGEAGLMNILVRELSQRLEVAAQYNLWLGSFRGLIFCGCSVVVGVTGLLLLFGPSNGELQKIVLLLGLTIVSMFQALTLASVVRAHEDMKYYALGFILKHLFLLAAVYLVTLLDAGFVATILAYASSYVFLWAYYHLLVSRRYGIPRILFNLSNWRYLLREAFPLGIGQVLRRSANYVDIFILRLTSGNVDIGLFSTAYRFILALSGTAVSISFPFFPAFSRLAAKQDDQLKVGLEKGLQFLVVAAIPFSMFLLVYGPMIVNKFFGAKFGPAGLDLGVLGLSLLIIFPSTLFLHLFSALGKQRLWSLCAASCLVINTLLDLILTPRWGHWGAVWGTMTAEIVLFGTAWYLLSRLTFHLSLVRLFSRPLLAGIAAGGLLFWDPGTSIAQIIIRSFGALLLYSFLLWVLRVFTFTGIVNLLLGHRPLEEEG
ncbi:MAG: flippase [Syntrophales bacterium]|nr:flippase [Syntrophales bacterium]